jgi:predicted RNase H-like HicB family nuclease
MKFKILVHPAEEGGYWAEVPALPGCVSEGETMAETLNNLREAAQGWLIVATERMLAAPLAQAQVMEIEL